MTEGHTGIFFFNRKTVYLYRDILDSMGLPMEVDLVDKALEEIGFLFDRTWAQQVCDEQVVI